MAAYHSSFAQAATATTTPAWSLDDQVPSTSILSPPVVTTQQESQLIQQQQQQQHQYQQHHHHHYQQHHVSWHLPPTSTTSTTNFDSLSSMLLVSAPMAPSSSQYMAPQRSSSLAHSTFDGPASSFAYPPATVMSAMAPVAYALDLHAWPAASTSSSGYPAPDSSSLPSWAASADLMSQPLVYTPPQFAGVTTTDPSAALMDYSRQDLSAYASHTAPFAGQDSQGSHYPESSAPTPPSPPISVSAPSVSGSPYMGAMPLVTVATVTAAAAAAAAAKAAEPFMFSPSSSPRNGAPISMFAAAAIAPEVHAIRTGSHFPPSPEPSPYPLAAAPSAVSRPSSLSFAAGTSFNDADDSPIGPAAVAAASPAILFPGAHRRSLSSASSASLAASIASRNGDESEVDTAVGSGMLLSPRIFNSQGSRSFASSQQYTMLPATTTTSQASSTASSPAMPADSSTDSIQFGNAPGFSDAEPPRKRHRLFGNSIDGLAAVTTSQHEYVFPGLVGGGESTGLSPAIRNLSLLRSGSLAASAPTSTTMAMFGLPGSPAASPLMAHSTTASSNGNNPSMDPFGVGGSTESLMTAPVGLPSMSDFIQPVTSMWMPSLVDSDAGIVTWSVPEGLPAPPPSSVRYAAPAAFSSTTSLTPNAAPAAMLSSDMLSMHHHQHQQPSYPGMISSAFAASTPPTSMAEALPLPLPPPSMSTGLASSQYMSHPLGMHVPAAATLTPLITADLLLAQPAQYQQQQQPASAPSSPVVKAKGKGPRRGAAAKRKRGVSDSGVVAAAIAAAAVDRGDVPTTLSTYAVSTAASSRAASPVAGGESDDRSGRGDDGDDDDGVPRPFVCSHAGCESRFARNHDLRRHERIHTGEKNWHCHECGRSFGRRDALARHTSAPGGRCKAIAGKRRPSKSNARDAFEDVTVLEAALLASGGFADSSASASTPAGEDDDAVVGFLPDASA